MSGTSTDDADGAGTSSTARDAAGGPVVELPLHLTERILYCISPLESARLATVCRSWAASVSARLAAPAPHLFVCKAPDKMSDDRGVVVSVPLDDGASGGGGALRRLGAPATIVPARVRSSDTNGLRCIGATPSGRVAFAAGWWSPDVVLVNPVTGVLRSIDVGTPRLDPRQGRVLVAGAGGGDSLFAVDVHELVLWRRAQRGSGEEWSRCAVATAPAQLTSHIVAAVSCGGCFYLMHQDGRLSMVDTTAPPPLPMEKLPVVSLLKDQFAAFPVEDHHLIESDGEVLVVRQLVAYKEEKAAVSCDHHDGTLSVVGFEVFRLDVKEQRWAKVHKLARDRALFVSPKSSFAVRVPETEGCRSNCIYFVGEKQYHCSRSVCHEHGGISWGVYSMEDRRVLFEHAVMGPGGCMEALWFLPRVV